MQLVVFYRLILSLHITVQACIITHCTTESE